jgi:hypothetical protein
MNPSAEPVHVSTHFDFEVDTPFATATLLFGPKSEMSWAGDDWKPVFYYPRPGNDVEGTVFTVTRNHHTGIWVNTLYDVAGGRMQYVSVIPQVVATVVAVKLSSVDARKTHVDVTYTRTALDPAANDDVRGLAQHDAASGPEWAKAIRSSIR